MRHPLFVAELDEIGRRRARSVRFAGQAVVNGDDQVGKRSTAWLAQAFDMSHRLAHQLAGVVVASFEPRNPDRKGEAEDLPS